MTRIRSNNERFVDGVSVWVQCIERLDYDGIWREHGFEVYCTGEKNPVEFIGYPIDSDIRRAFPEIFKLKEGD